MLAFVYVLSVKEQWNRLADKLAVYQTDILLVK